MPYVTELVREFEADALINGYSQSTMRHRVVSVRRFLHKSLTRPDIATLSERDLVKYLSHLRREPAKGQTYLKANSTINSELKAVRQFARWAVRKSLMGEDITAGIQGLKESDAVRLAPCVPDVKALMRAARTRPSVTEEQRRRDYLMIIMCVDTGLRIGELIGEGDLPGVRVGDVTDRHGNVKGEMIIKGKGGVQKALAITSPVKEAIEDYLPYRRAMAGVDQLVVSVTGGRMSYRGTEKLLRTIREHACVEIQWHDLRRFFATQMWLRDIDGTSLDQLMGHSDARTRARYIRDAIVTKALEHHRALSPASLLAV